MKPGVFLSHPRSRSSFLGNSACSPRLGAQPDYDDPNKRIDEIHSKHKERLDKFSTTLKLRVVEGTRHVNREMTLYSAKGVYEICRWSRQPKADNFYDHVYDILEGLRLGYLKLLYERQTPAWQTARIEGKKTRRLETDAIKMFVEYARAQGSKNPDKYYMNFTKLANQVVGITPGDRDGGNTAQLLDLRTVEHVTYGGAYFSFSFPPWVCIMGMGFQPGKGVRLCRTVSSMLWKKLLTR